jgi:hypothetical protein
MAKLVKGLEPILAGETVCHDRPSSLLVFTPDALMSRRECETINDG